MFALAGQVLTERRRFSNDPETAFRDNVWGIAYVNQLAMVENAGTTPVRYYPLQDANWNVTALVGKTPGGVWEVRRRFVYDPYGGVSQLQANWNGYGAFDRQVNPEQWSYFFQGGRATVHNWGLYHFQNRMLDGWSGRWMQQDRLGYVAGMNLYEGMRSNPSTYTDPSGQAVPFLVAGILANALLGALVGAGIGGVIGGVDRWLGDGSFWEGFKEGAIIGGVIGGIGGAVAPFLSPWLVAGSCGATIAKRLGFGVNLAGGIFGVQQALSNGNYGQAGFRGTLGVLGMGGARWFLNKQILKHLGGSNPTPGAWSRGMSDWEAKESLRAALNQTYLGRAALSWVDRTRTQWPVVNNPAAIRPGATATGGFIPGSNTLISVAPNSPSLASLTRTFIHESLHAIGIRQTRVSEIFADWIPLVGQRARPLMGPGLRRIPEVYYNYAELPLLFYGDVGLFFAGLALTGQRNR